MSEVSGDVRHAGSVTSRFSGSAANLRAVVRRRKKILDAAAA
jgi:hypothetical protein